MPKLPVLSYLEVIKALNKIGYNIDHQTGRTDMRRIFKLVLILKF